MNYAGTVFYGHIVAQDHPECVALERLEPWNQLMVADTQKVLTLEAAFQNGEGNL